MSTDDVIEIHPDPAAGGGRRRLVAVAALVAVLVVAGGAIAWAAGRDTGATSGAQGGTAPACPTTAVDPVSSTADLARLVPATPTASGIGGRLVPARAPAALELCEYLPRVYAPQSARSPSLANGPRIGDVPVTATLDLHRAAESRGDDARVAAVVGALQQATVPGPNQDFACRDLTGATSTRYLIGLGYADGTVWVASPGGCAGSTNGLTASGTDVSAATAAALSALPDEAVTAPPATGLPPVPGTGVPGTGAPGTDVPGPGDPGTVVPGASSSAHPGTAGPSTEPAEPGTTAPSADPFAACTPAATTGPTDPSGPSGRLVPFAATSVVVCSRPVTGTATTTKAPAAVAVRLMSALDDLATLEPDVACTDIGGPAWRLLFGDDAGRQAVVAVDAGGCGTASNGRGVVKKSNAALLAELATVS